MNKKLTALVMILICMQLDSVVFTRINLFDIRPDAMLAATVSFGILQGPIFGAVYGAIGGVLAVNKRSKVKPAHRPKSR